MADGGRDGGGDAGDAGEAAPCNGPPGLYLTGFCDDEHLAPGVRRFEPQFALWSDGAAKDRYISLPAGEQINTSDPDNWVFPVGTRVWKTFSLDGVRLETRLLEKFELGVGIAHWRTLAYAWNAAQNSVTEVSRLGLAFRENVLGTDHDIPEEDDCVTCHIGASGEHDALNGFSALQLHHDDDGVTLQTLIDEALLSTATPTIPDADPMSWIEAAEIPARNETERAAVGYLHANCAHCHRQGGQASITQLHTFIQLGRGTFADLAINGAIGQTSLATGVPRCEIHPNSDPGESVVILRMENRGDTLQMPPLATEFVDESGLATVRAWLEGLNEPAPVGGWPCVE